MNLEVARFLFNVDLCVLCLGTGTSAIDRERPTPLFLRYTLHMMIVDWLVTWVMDCYYMVWNGSSTFICDCVQIKREKKKQQQSLGGKCVDNYCMYKLFDN